MSVLTTRFIEEKIKYTGEQLRSHWVLERFGLGGDCAVAFVGPCDVLPEHMKDIEDLKAGAEIRSEKMLHFIVEHFDTDLDRAVLRQRLLLALIADALNRRLAAFRVRRTGDDLYDGTSKLTVSIAAPSPVSTLIHAGINVSSANTPVPAVGLDDYRIAPQDLAREILSTYAHECASARRARCKVRPCE